MEKIKAGAVLVKHPQFDKIAALVVLERFLQIPLPIARFWESNEEPDAEVWDSWIRRNLVPIDIGEDKYHTRGTGSALESIMTDYEIPKTGPLYDLLGMVNRNNNTGYLKGAWGSIVWILREMYKMDYDQREVIEAVKRVISSFLDASVMEKQDGELERVNEIIRQLDPDIAKGNFAPFTIGNYIRNMVRLGMSREVILAKVDYFLDAWKEAKQEQTKAKREVADGVGYRIVQQFNVSGGSAVLVKLAGDNPFVTRELLKCFRLVIVRNRNNRVAIQTIGGDLFPLAEHLKRTEEKLWFYDSRLPVLLNSSREQYECEPTKLTDDELIQLVTRLVSFGNRAVQHGVRR